MFILNALRLNSKKSRLKVKIPKKLHYLLFCTIFLCAGIGAWGQPTTYTWTGGTDTSWIVPSNWSGESVPSANTDTVLIPKQDGGVDIINFPVIRGSVTIAKLTVNIGASLTINAGGDLDVTGTLTNNGTIIVGAASGGTGQLTVPAVTNSGTITVNSTGKLAVTGTLTNQGSGTIAISSASGNKSTVGTLDNTSDALAAITVDAGGDLDVTGTLTNNGTIIVGAASGGTGQLTVTTVTNNRTITINGTGKLAVTGTLTNSGTITINGTLTADNDFVNTNGTINGGSTGVINITFASSVTLTGTIDTTGEINRTTGTTTISTNIKAGKVFFSRAVTLGAGVTIETTGNITFASTIDSDATARSLTLDAQGTSSTVTLGGAVGGGAVGGSPALAKLEVTGGTGITVNAPVKTTGDITFTGNTSLGANVTSTSGNILFKSPVTLSATPIEITADVNITFNSTINGTTADSESLTLTASGMVTLNSAVGTDKTLKSLTVTASNDIKVEKAVTIAGAIVFTGTTGITIAENATITSETGTITFTGNTSLGANVTSTSGNILFKSPVTLSATLIEIKTTTSGDITFLGATSTIGGAYAFNLNAKGTVTLGGAVGVPTNLASLTVTATSAINIYSSVVTTGAQSFTARAQGVRLLGNTNRNWTASDITLDTTDLYFDHSGDTINLGSDLRCQNLYFYRGNLATSKTITTSKDFVVFGTDYSPDDGGWAGTDTRHAYYHENLAYYPTGVTYDSTKKILTFPLNFTNATFTNLTTAVINITGTGNFYNNGANMNVGAFTLNIPVNTGTIATTNITDTVTDTQWGVPYAVAFNMTVANSTAAGGWVTAAKGTKGQNVTNGTSNSNWQFARPEITEAYTVSEDVIYIKFNMLIENGNNEIRDVFTPLTTPLTSADAGGVWYDEKILQFADGAFSNKACTLPLTNATNPTHFYIRTTTSGTWNTDATGTNDGDAQSTDKDGSHKDVRADLSFLKGVFYAAEGKTMNRAYGVKDVGEGSFTGTTDKCKPVLIGVYTGQEMHGDPGTTPSTNLKTYDAHNFIEFQYSEPVNIGDTDLDGTANNTNIRANATLGDISASGSGLAVAGLATIANGTISTGSRDGNNSVNSLYRNFSLTPSIAATTDQTHRVRVSIAGFVDGTDTIDGEVNHKWIGYIDSATLPSGLVTLVPAGVNDKAVDASGNPAYNDLDTTVKPTVNTFPSVNALPTDGLYTLWDTSPPVFAKYSIDTTTWTDLENNEKEITGYSSTNLMQNIEFHFFDNTPTYQVSEQFQWDSGIGWTTINDFNDTYGGSRFNPNPAPNPTNRTKGGIRASSVVGSIDAFNIQIDGARIEIDSINFKQKLNNTDLFGSSGGGVDTPYLSLNLTGTTEYLLNTHFTIKYNGNTGFVTDLAGNRMKTDNLAEALDTPRIILTVAPVGMSEVYILFSSQMDTSAESLEMIPKNLNITTFPGFDLAVKADVPARVATNTSHGTGFIITLDREVTYADITASSGTGTATITNNFTIVYPPPTGVQGIKRKGGGVYALGQATPLSTFGVNVVNPLYAYDNRLLDDDAPGFQGENLFAEGELAVRLFDGSGSSGNSVLAGEDITLGLTSVVPDTDTAIMILGTNPSPGSISTEFNKITGLNTRVWVPTPFVIPAISSDANTSPVKELPNIVDPTTNIPFPALGFNAGDRVEFLFRIDGKTIDHDNDGTTANPTPHIPFYVLRLKDPVNPSSIDLWSLDLLDIVQQRGNVTILNNVINTNVGEKTRIEINMPSAGNLTVQVLTIDGNVVKSLHRGRAEEGLRYYTWDGTNNSGDSVARGMYFVRVVGPGIDETRKVMAIKE